VITVIDIGLSFLEGYLSRLRYLLPVHVVAAVQAAIDALAAHKADLITKQNLEAQRG